MNRLKNLLILMALSTMLSCCARVGDSSQSKSGQESTTVKHKDANVVESIDLGDGTIVKVVIIGTRPFVIATTVWGGITVYPYAE